jgi:CelD/BcsL family acetyltransferase involved in cellulose biosynthesis
MLATELITELSKLDPLEAEWDELAVAGQLPLMAPACVRAWWRSLAAPTAEPRVLVVRDDRLLLGLAPFYEDPGARGGRQGLRLPGIELGGRLAPLAAPGQRQEVERALAQALADRGLCSRFVALEGVPVASDWAQALREAWPGRSPASRRYQLSGCPTVSLQAGSFEAWLRTKSSNFRREMRRLRRQFEIAGGTTRSSTLETLGADVEVFVRLHDSRWEDRGSSRLQDLGAGLPAVLNDIGRTLLNREGRFRLRLCELEGEPISAQLFLAAGGRVLYVNGGWDERFARFKPSMLGILAVIEEAFERGEDRVDLGLGEQHYKRRFADGNDPVAWTILIPTGAGLPLTLLRTAPMRSRARLLEVLRRRLSEQQMGRLSRAWRRLGG